MTFGVEHLQGDEVLREGIQIVNTVILKDKERPVFPSFLSFPFFLLFSPEQTMRQDGCRVTYVDSRITNVNVFHFFIRFLASPISYAVPKELAVYGVAARRLPCQINRRR